MIDALQTDNLAKEIKNIAKEQRVTTKVSVQLIAQPNQH